MVSLDIIERVQIIDHQAEGLRHAFGRSVAEKIQLLQPCAVAKMKARHRIERLAGWPLHFQELVRCGRTSNFAGSTAIASLSR